MPEVWERSGWTRRDFVPAMSGLDQREQQTAVRHPGDGYAERRRRIDRENGGGGGEARGAAAVEGRDTCGC